MLSVIHGTKEEKEKQKLDLAIIYGKACNRANEANFNDDNRDNLSKLVYYWVKYLDLVYSLCDSEMKTAPIEHIKEFFQTMEAVKEHIKLLTPNELIRIFPITKRYDGERYQSKDYFYTMDILKKHGLDNPIGAEVDNILWDYTNNQLTHFVVNLMSVVSNLHRAQTGQDMFLDFIKEQGEHLTTYTMSTDPKTGKQYMTNNDTGKTVRVFKKKPRYLKAIISGESI